MIFFDTKAVATFLLQVLKHNKELLTDSTLAPQAVIAIETRLLEAYYAGQRFEPLGEETCFVNNVELTTLLTPKNN